jgi:electron transfer flavoprotein beta subunit
MGAHRAVLVTDPILAGSDIRSTVGVLAAALAGLEYDLVLAGIDTSDGYAGVVPAALATALGLPLLSNAAAIEPELDAGRVRVRRIIQGGYDVLEAPLPALVSCTQALGAPRYPSLKGIMAARSKEVAVRSLADLGPTRWPVGGAAAATTVVAVDPPPARGATRTIRASAVEAAREIADFLAARRLLP